MYTYFIILFFVVCALAFIEDRLSERQKLCILLPLIVVMTIVPATKPLGIDPDSVNYENMFYNNDNPLTEISTEPTFIYISRAVIACGGTMSAMFAIYALLSVPTRLIATFKMTPHVFTAMMIYVPWYYVQQDMQQIRAAVAAAILMFALITVYKGNKWHSFLLVALATLFHYSSLLFFPVILWGNRPLSKKMRLLLAGLAIGSAGMYALGKDLFFFLPTALVGGKIDFYKEAVSYGIHDDFYIAYKNIAFMSKCLLFLFALYFYDRIKTHMSILPLIIVCTACSIISYLTLSSVPVIGLRFSELYGIIDPIFFTVCLYFIHPILIPRICIMIVGLYQLIYYAVGAQQFS